jgi:hypothetical protein
MSETAPSRVWITRDQWGRAYAYEHNRHGSTEYVRADAMAEAVSVERCLLALREVNAGKATYALAKRLHTFLASQGDAK